MTDYKQELEEILDKLYEWGYESGLMQGSDWAGELKFDKKIHLKINEATTALNHLINKAKVEELKRLKAIDAFNEAYTLDPRPAKLVDMRIKELES